MSRRKLHVVFGSLGLVGLAVGAVACHQLAASDPVDRLEWIRQTVRSDFPEVQRIRTEELHRRLEGGETPLLLDVRRADEYAVSHLPGALRVEPGIALEDLDPEVAQALEEAVRGERQIVAYCSVGYRSARFLRDFGLLGERAWNLEGSIFEWASRGYPLVTDDGTSTRTVHPYSRAWAWLVDEDLRAWEPPRPVD